MNADVKTRLYGVACVVAGAAISWPTMFDRFRMAAQGAERIQTWFLASFMVGPLIVIGLTMMVLGARADALTRDAERSRLRPLGKLIAFACIVTGFAGSLGTDYLLRSLGYQ